jgi:hypothetical protein
VVPWSNGQMRRGWVSTRKINDINKKAGAARQD